SKPGPPCNNSSVGLLRMIGPSGTRPAPSTSKKRRTSFTNTRIGHACITQSAIYGPNVEPERSRQYCLLDYGSRKAGVKIIFDRCWEKILDTVVSHCRA